MSTPTTWRRAALTVALTSCLTCVVHAQSVTGSIFGQVPSAANTTVIIRSLDTGFTRTLSVDAQGRYRATELPNGRYRVILQQDGNDIASRDNVVVNIASGTEVSFTGGAGDVTALDRVEVRGISAPPIDISQVDTRSVLTYEQLQAIPTPRTVTSAALLAPGAVASNSYQVEGESLASFGGSAASENAYYINGFPVTNPLTSLGFTQLPFEAIGQQQTLTGGYGAEFGRSTGGVVNVVTRRGNNQWKGGAYTMWAPKSLRATPRNLYYANTGHFPADDPRGPAFQTDGTLDRYRNQDTSWENTTGLHGGGPLIQDRLFFYGNVELTQAEGQRVVARRQDSPANLGSGYEQYAFDTPAWMGKLDWYITDDHMLEFTGLSHVTKRDRDRYSFDYNTFSHGSNQVSGTETRNDARLYIGKYTGYLTDTLTLSVLYGRQKVKRSSDEFGYVPECQLIVADPENQAPGFNYTGCQPATSMIRGAGEGDKTEGGRLDLTWRLGNHEIHIGYDRQDAESHVDSFYPGGYRWVYNRTGPNTAIDPSNGVIGTPASAGGLGIDGYYVARNYRTIKSDPKTEQAAQFIEDRWQISDRWLLSLGLRNEQFTNFTGTGEKFLSQRHQLAPRLGAVWDARGDSSLKLFANAGRYHLSLPNGVAQRGAAGASHLSSEYYTYTGVDPATGAPIGLAPIAVDPGSIYLCPGIGDGGAISTNLECGTGGDPRTIAAIDMKSHYQDEYILGMEQALEHNMSWGAKFTYRDLKSAIDDTCTPVLNGGCFMFNPGKANSFWVETAEGSGVFERKDYSAEELGFGKLKRRYYALDMYWEQRTENWYAKVEYTLSRNYGNTEGQLSSELDVGEGGQMDVSQTQDWDLPQLMQGGNGVLPNHRAHVIKAFGYLQMGEQWRAGMSLVMASGRPRNCTSMYPTPDQGLYGGSAYWFCGLPGTNGGNDPSAPNYVPPTDDYGPSPRGSHGTTPWMYNLNLNLTWNPRWVNGLSLQADVMNVLNRQNPNFYNPRYALAGGQARRADGYNPFYGQALNLTEERYVRFTVRYDF